MVQPLLTQLSIKSSQFISWVSYTYLWIQLESVNSNLDAVSKSDETWVNSMNQNQRNKTDECTLDQAGNNPRIVRTALYWIITQRVVTISYRQVDPKHWQEITTCCVRTQKSAVLIYFVAEAWNHTSYTGIQIILQHPQASKDGTQNHLLYLYNLPQDYKSVLGTKHRSQKFFVAVSYWIHYKIILETHLSNFSFLFANLTAGLRKRAVAATLEDCVFSSESLDEVGSLPERTFSRGRGKWKVPRRWYPTIWIPSVSRYINYVYGQCTSGHKSIRDKMYNGL